MVKSAADVAAGVVACLVAACLISWAALSLRLLTPPVAEPARHLLTWAGDAYRSHPRMVAAAVALPLLTVLGRLLRGLARPGGPRDPRRTFTPDERRVGFTRAGHRCEFDTWVGLRRCSRAAEHADHWWPHTRGGASTLTNLVAACGWHNTSKGARLPTPAQTRRLTRRRRRYFPPGDHTVPGQRYRAAR